MEFPQSPGKKCRAVEALDLGCQMPSSDAVRWLLKSAPRIDQIEILETSSDYRVKNRLGLSVGQKVGWGE